MRKSAGADLAALLESAEAYDAAYYHRSRVNLLEEYGLPAGEPLAYQVGGRAGGRAGGCLWVVAGG